MKKLMITALSLLLVLTSVTAQENKVPKWVSAKGYWVVESNVKDPFHHIIRFYTNDDVLMYKETITGMRLNTGRTRVKMKLRKALEQSAIAWEQSKVAVEEKQYVSAILK